MKAAALSAAEAFMRAHDSDPEHALQVCRTSLALFDATRALHKLGPAARRVLAGAALMHDTGFSVDVGRHHKHARDLILNADLEGFSPNEQRMVACVARYHRKAHPAPGHKVYRDLAGRDQAVVRRLSALLRLADGLDRSHAGSTQAVRFRQKGDSAKLYVKQPGTNTTDIWGAERKRELFEQEFELQLEILADNR